jgi:hydrogenase/urease accessory protein HupE
MDNDGMVLGGFGVGAGRSVTGRRSAAVAAIAAATVLVLPQAAWAHGVGGTSESVAGFVGLGFNHMLLGWDHLLFVAGVVLIAGRIKRAATMMSIFALGHSITLFVASVAGWHVNATLVDVVIALSVVFVGVVGLTGRPKNWTWFGLAVGGLGLVHGLGLSTRLQALGLPEDGVIPRILAFNLGVELGQLFAVTLIYAAGIALTRYVTWARLPRAGHIAVIAGGVLAAALLPFTGADEPAPAQAVSSSCQTRERTETYPAGGGHANVDFSEPGQEPPTKSFGHVIGDGYVIVHYPPALPADQLAQLRTFVTDPASGRVVGAAQQQPEVLKAVNAYTTLTCTAFDMPALETFVKDWFADPRSKPAE